MTYWCDEKLVVHIVGPEGEGDVVIEQPYAQIGAHSQSQIVLTGPGVAKRSLLLLATASGIYSLNLDLEDARLEERGRWLSDGEPLLVGPYSLTVRTASGQFPRSPAPDLVAVKSRMPIPVVHVYCGRLLKDRRRFRYPLSIIGRRPQCSLQLRGLQVSSFHCAMFWHEQRLWCIDLLSSNGTRRSGEPFVCGELRLGDRLEVGEFGLLYYRWSPRRSTPGMTPEQAADDPRRIDAPSAEPPIDAPLIAAPAAPPAPPPVAESHEPPDALVLDIAAFRQGFTVEQERQRQTVAAELAHLAADRLAMQRQTQAAADQLKRRRAEVEQEAARLAEERQALETTRNDFQREHNTMTQQLADRDTKLSRLQLDLAAANALLNARGPEPAAEQPQHSDMAADRDQLAAERLAFQQESSAAAEQLKRRLHEVEEDAARLADERRALEETRNQWRQERDALMHQLADRAAQLSRLEVDLAAAKDSRASRAASPEAPPVVRDSPGPAPAPHIGRWLTEPARPATLAAVASDAPVVRGSPDPAPAILSALRGSPDPAPTAPVVRGSPDPAHASPAPAVRGSHDPAVATTSFARRRTQDRDELTSFVSGRLGHIEHARLRQIFLLWTAIALSFFTLGLLAFGIWSWLF